ncbi:hypothetical protein [Pseudomonas sp. PDM31]|uniref:hypothetical protein n=1 Tax=Pseudomonas sp. PDM31 TaxID=2854778 RepID=UPI00210956D5|nr:hypothetical protein [Pseudomonas sp. PDM31]
MWWILILLLPLWLPFLVLLLIVLWRIAVLPTATVHYSKKGLDDLRFIWNVQDRVYKGRLPPGSSTGDHGFLFPDEKFFMEISWWNDGDLRRCVNITPKWSNTHIYLDANGHVDRSSTDFQGLKQCITDPAPP